MAIIREIIKWYTIINEDWANPHNNDRFMISSPWPGLTLLGLYIYFVHNLGPRFMARRQPFKLDRILQLYNIFQILINAYIFYKALVLTWLEDDYSYFCQPIDFTNTAKATEIARVVWVYFLIKLLDLLDTVFFVLRKKQNQVSFLHVYHHIGMVMVCWSASKYLPGGHVTFLGLLNSFVHMIMYTHYLLASMKINTNSWKKYITQLQLMQFFLFGLFYTQLFWIKEDCDFPVWSACIIIPQNFFLIILFGEFYYKTYIMKKPSIKVPNKNENSISVRVTNGKTKEP